MRNHDDIAGTAAAYTHGDAVRFLADAGRYREEAERSKAEAEGLRREAARLAHENELMREEIRLLRARRFGASSERSHLDGQGVLFNEAEALSSPGAPEPGLADAVPAARRARPRGKRGLDLAGLPVRRVEHELPEAERVCPQCSGALHDMGADVRVELEYVPASYTVVEHATHKYACRRCQAEAEATPVVAAPAPAPLFLGSLASPSLLAQVLCDKYLYHLPLYRQEAAFAHDGISLSRQTLSNWVVMAAERWLWGVYDGMRAELVGGTDVAHADETGLQVLNEPGREASQKGFMWLYRTGAYAERPCVVYEYRETRHHGWPAAFLAGYSGWLHADGYAGYHQLPEAVRVVGCWAHARRKLDEALKAAPAAARAGSLAEEGLSLINRLFDLERGFAGMEPEDRFDARLRHSLPAAEAVFAWAGSAGALPESLAGKAVGYLLEQREWLMRVFEDGRLELTNNRAERSIKPFVIGRKNWLFSNTPAGAEASAVVFSVIETAKENRLSVYEYLKYLLEELPNRKSSGIADLMPWSESLPMHVKVLPTGRPAAPV